MELSVAPLHEGEHVPELTALNIDFDDLFAQPRVDRVELLDELFSFLWFVHVRLHCHLGQFFVPHLTQEGQLTLLQQHLKDKPVPNQLALSWVENDLFIKFHEFTGVNYEFDQNLLCLQLFYLISRSSLKY